MKKQNIYFLLGLFFLFANNLHAQVSFDPTQSGSFTVSANGITFSYLNTINGNISTFTVKISGKGVNEQKTFSVNITSSNYLADPVWQEYIAWLQEVFQKINSGGPMSSVSTNPAIRPGLQLFSNSLKSFGGDFGKTSSSGKDETTSDGKKKTGRPRNSVSADVAYDIIILSDYSENGDEDASNLGYTGDFLFGSDDGSSMSGISFDYNDLIIANNASMLNGSLSFVYEKYGIDPSTGEGDPSRNQFISKTSIVKAEGTDASFAQNFSALVSLISGDNGKIAIGFMGGGSYFAQNYYFNYGAGMSIGFGGSVSKVHIEAIYIGTSRMDKQFNKMGDASKTLTLGWNWDILFSESFGLNMGGRTTLLVENYHDIELVLGSKFGF